MVVQRSNLVNSEEIISIVLFVKNVEPFSIHANCPSPCIIRNNSPTSAGSPGFATRLSNTLIMFAYYLDVKVLNWEGLIENFEVRLLMFLHKSIGKLGPSVEEDGLPGILCYMSDNKLTPQIILLMLCQRENETFESYIVQKKAFVIQMGLAV
ncbi:hypothetical protein T01_15281 [Trichinella spiralis]|uniref:Uncharacterized protein n=1 Tax=Trichinella spiralis TaxID=6334 RepID=A0A0V1BEX1_TRISP|nr:hypothetical protein T01_15281 [Trichinella spiralis]